MTQGSFQVSGDYFGARVTYSCEDGFFMSGTRERVCQGDGTWSDQPPTCKKEGKYRVYNNKNIIVIIMSDSDIHCILHVH